MDDYYLGTILLWAGNFAPRNFEFCAGQIIPIQQNTVLYSILGTAYGGDGRTTFALPDLRGRMPLGNGQGPGLPNYFLGERAGNYQTTLDQAHMPVHNHSAEFSPTGGGTPADVQVSTNPIASTGTPEDGSYLAAQKAVGGASLFVPGTPAPTETVSLGGVSGGGGGGGTVTVGNTGQGLPFSNQPPFSAVNFIICTAGLYPARD